jgi:hypothetical protein
MPDRQFRPHRAETPLLDLLENLAVMQTDTELEDTSRGPRSW